MDEYLEISERAAQMGGEVLLKMRGRVAVTSKGPRDFVTDADHASQQAIQRIVLERFPDHGFLGEEETPGMKASIGEPGYLWIVDPLDGTTNFVHGLDHFCVSVALAHGNEILVATVYDPARDETFSAVTGQGAFLNGNRLSTSDAQGIEDSLIAGSLPAAVTRESPEIRCFNELSFRCQAIRRFGSAALNLCYVAAGRIDAYWATSVKAWDVAAGVLVVREAGGVVTDVTGGPFQLKNPRLIAAATTALQEGLRDCIKESGSLDRTRN